MIACMARAGSITISALLPQWMHEESECQEPVLGGTIDAALELPVWHAEPTHEDVDGLALSDMTDPPGHAGAVYDLAGTMLWFLDRETWLLASVGLCLAGGDVLANVDRDKTESIQLRDIPSRALIRAPIYIAPLGAWAYWPKAQASRRWLVRGIDRTAETWIVELSPL